MRQLQLMILLALACYRVTRFIVKDSLIQGFRIWLHTALLGNKPRLWRDKLQELISCPFCISVWIAAALVAGVNHYRSVSLPFVQWLAVAGATCVIWNLTED